MLPHYLFISPGDSEAAPVSFIALSITRGWANERRAMIAGIHRSADHDKRSDSTYQMAIISPSFT